MPNFIRVEFYKGSRIMYEVPCIYLSDWNGKKITLPNECTGFAIVHKKFEINGNIAIMDEERRLVGAFVGPTMLLGELKEKNSKEYGYQKSENPDLEDNTECCIYEDGRCIPLGKNDYVVRQEELETILNSAASFSISMDRNAEIISHFTGQYMKIRRRKAHKTTIIE